MPKDDINYSFTENGIVYDFYDVFVPAENFRQPSLWVWGLNSNGQLGINDTNTRTTPVTTFAGGTTWKQISCGGAHTAAIKTDGTLWIWGATNDGRLGDNTTTTRSIPVTTFAGGTNWKQVSAGNQHTAAIKTDGSLWIWGGNLYGQLGINLGNVTRLTPVTTFAGGNNWKQVTCGGRHSAAVKTDGTLWVWGSNEFGQLGINLGNVTRSIPVTTFAGGTDWKSVACGSLFTSAIKTDGTLWNWGNNDAGQSGDNTTTNRSTPVTTFAGGNNWKQVTCGYRHTVATKTDGTLWGLGRNTEGQLGDNTTTTRSIPVTTFAGGTNWKQVSCGTYFTVATKTDGTLWTWGDNNNGQLGIDNTSRRSIPVTTFAGGNNWKSVSSGDSHTAAIKYQPDP